MAEKPKTTSIEKHSVIKRILKENRESPQRQTRVIRGCSTHPKALEDRRIAIQQKIQDAKDLLKEIEAGTLEPEEESRAYELVTLFGMIAGLECQTLGIDIQSKRTVTVRRKPDGKHDILGITTTYLGGMVQNMTDYLEEIRDNSYAAAAMQHDWIALTNPDALKKEVKDENGVPSEVRDFYKEFFDPGDDDTEKIDEEPVEMDEEELSEDVRTLVAKAKQRVKIDKEKARAKTEKE